MKVESSSSSSSTRGKIQEKSLRHQIFSLYIFWLICKKNIHHFASEKKETKVEKKIFNLQVFFFLSNHRQISFSHMSEVSMALKLGSFVCSYVNKSSSCTLVKDWKVGWNLSWLIVHYICSAKYLGTILAKTWLLGLAFFFYAQKINLYLTLNVIFFFMFHEQIDAQV